MGFAKHAADTVAIIAEGRLVEVGNSSQVIDYPRTARAQKFLKAYLKF
jgi:ABC-type polar amino acid transport system ATPase subunit